MKKYKYKINHFLELLPRGISIKEVEEILKREHKISRDTFYRDRNLVTRDKGSIPLERIEIYASLFDIATEDLKNYKKKKIKPLKNRL